MPLLFLLFVAMSTGVFAAYAGRDEIRHSGEPVWRAEAFLAYALWLGSVLLPTVLYFYVFHGDWFLFYWVDTHRAPWVWGLLAALSLLGASFAGFHLGAALCRASRDLVARRLAIGAAIVGVAVWPLVWGRLSVVGTYRQFTREYGLVGFLSSPAWYSGLVMLAIVALSFTWVAFRIDRQTRDTI